ncbi:Multidrug resistance protein 1, partial [Ophiophagus hannah]
MGLGICVCLDEISSNGYDNPAFQLDETSPQKGHLKNKKIKNNETSKKKEKQMIGFFELFTFADALDIILIIVGCIAAVAAGTGQPIIIIIFGQMTNSFVVTSLNVSTGSAEMNNSACPQAASDIENQMASHAYYFVGIGFAVLLCSFFEICTFVIASARQTSRIRDKFFFAVLHQEMAWFDTTPIGTLNTRLTEDINTIHKGIGDKIAILIQNFSTFLTGVIIGFAYGWKLTLVILSVTPLIAVSGGLWSYILSMLTTKELMAYAKAGSVAEEILSAIRTVIAFNGQKKAIARYDKNLEEAQSIGTKKTITTNISTGVSQFLIYGCYALAFWYGTKLTVDERDNYDIGTVLIVFFSVLIGAFSLGQASPNLENVANARGAAYQVFKIIKKPRPIDSSSTEGFKLDKLRGEIEFKNIYFSYPSRPNIQILRGLNLKIQPGQTIALVGSSGCGKSTTIQLLQRFYDPPQGQITIDGHDIRTLNIKWMRENIGIVSQEPVLFATTIAGNIRYGTEDITDAEIEQAAKEANAYDFIMKLPDKFNTMVGERGAQLSGGQKQRIAIARALARNPKILLLDEATSALDNQSESIVQAALDQARAGRTTIVIAHRLSTIRTADVIAGFEKGVLVEQGTHSELMAHKGVYYALVMQQNYQSEEPESETSNEETEFETEDENSEISEKEDLYETADLNDLGSSNRGTEVAKYGSLRRISNRPSLSRASTKRFSERKRRKKQKRKAKKVRVKETLPDVPYTRILALNKPEFCYIAVGVIAAAIAGGVTPAFAVLFGKIIGGFTFGKSGEALTMRLRSLSFKALLQQATGSRLALMTMTFFTLVTALIIAFAHGWHLTLLILACIPFIIVAKAIQAKSMEGHAAQDQKALEEAGRSFNFFINAGVFRFGAWLIAHCFMNFEQLFIVFSSVIFAAMNAGQANSLAPDFSKSKVSAQRIFHLLDRKPAIDSYSEEGEKLEKFEGNIEFKDIHFAYPTRPEVQVLQGLNVKINKGQTLALVGSSGCGKSTSIQLLERFYDPMSGQVIADGVDTKSLHIQWLRSRLGLVQQEPILFDCSIAENIQYGDNSRVVSQEEIEEAAKAANIHNFIENLPEKYNTRVGDKGAQLSGGQKQRIAIARALVRKPAVLLLDEATSALDTESEKVSGATADFYFMELLLKRFIKQCAGFEERELWAGGLKFYYILEEDIMLQNVLLYRKTDGHLGMFQNQTLNCRHSPFFSVQKFFETMVLQFHASLCSIPDSPVFF